MTKPTLKIGDTVYQFNEGARTYRRDENGRATGGPIYAGHFQPHKITGEEKRSWIVLAPGHAIPNKIGKNTIDGEYSVWNSAERMAAKVWAHENGRTVGDSVRKCTHLPTLKAIAALLIEAGALRAEDIKE